MGSSLRRTLIQHNMIDQTLIVTQMLKELNYSSIPTSTIEKEIGIASGYLWKVKKGRKHLGEDKMKLLEEYHAKHCNKVVHKSPVTIISTPKKENKPVSAKIIEIKSKESKPGSLADMMKELRSEPNRSLGQSYKRSKI